MLSMVLKPIGGWLKYQTHLPVVNSQADKGNVLVSQLIHGFAHELNFFCFLLNGFFAGHLPGQAALWVRRHDPAKPGRRA